MAQAAGMLIALSAVVAELCDFCWYFADEGIVE